jgi:hypothetical protein
VFGGICVVLLGDLMQLKQPKSKHVFQQPSNPQFQLYHVIDPLFERFEVINLVTNHRQGNALEYAQLLSRIRFDNHTDQDMELLKTRCIDENHPICNTSTIVLCKHVQVAEANTKRLAMIKSKLIIIKAEKIPPIGMRGKKFEFINHEDGSILDMPFWDVLMVKKTARVMITFNMDTADKLSNGQRGNLTHIEEDSESGEVLWMVVALDDPSAGRKRKLKYPGRSKKYGGVVIMRQDYQYSIEQRSKNHAATARIRQFPITLSWAITAHKVQGQTVKPPSTLVSDISTVFMSNQAYVILTRVQSLDQLYLINFDEKKIYANKESKKKSDMLNEKSLELIAADTWYDSNQEGLRISHLNIRSLHAHYNDLKLKKNEELCYLLLPMQFAAASLGPGKGVCIFFRKGHVVTSIINDLYCILKVKIETVCVICVYAKSGVSQIQLYNEVLPLIVEEKEIVMIGDFNFVVVVVVFFHYTM